MGWLKNAVKNLNPVTVIKQAIADPKQAVKNALNPAKVVITAGSSSGGVSKAEQDAANASANSTDQAAAKALAAAANNNFDPYAKPPVIQNASGGISQVVPAGTSIKVASPAIELLPEQESSSTLIIYIIVSVMVLAGVSYYLFKVQK